MIFALVGQPNCGKSTLFNEVAGYRSMVGNFPGITATYTTSSTQIGEQEVDITDLPGLYSLFGGDEAEQVSVRYLEDHRDEIVIVNIVDSSVLSRSMELTLQLMELGRPMVLALNMMDDARRKGLEIDIQGLSKDLGLPVVPMVARKGLGVQELLEAASRQSSPAKPPPYPQEFIDSLLAESGRGKTGDRDAGWPRRFLSMKDMETQDSSSPEGELSRREELRDRLSELRHDLSFRLFEHHVRLGSSLRGEWRRLLDDWLLHPFFGNFTLMLFFVLLLWSVMTFAAPGGEWVGGVSDQLHGVLQDMAFLPGLVKSTASGLIDGVLGGIDIALFYLVPFFFFLGFVEDSGYLARVAFLMDRLMHRIGLHGLSVIPMMLGLGCTVPAILSTRMIASRWDRMVTAVLTTLVPCSARTVVILGLVGAIFGVWSVVGTYFLVVVVLALSGKLLCKT